MSGKTALDIDGVVAGFLINDLAGEASVGVYGYLFTVNGELGSDEVDMT